MIRLFRQRFYSLTINSALTKTFYVDKKNSSLMNKILQLYLVLEFKHTRERNSTVTLLVIGVANATMRERLKMIVINGIKKQ